MANPSTNSTEKLELLIQETKVTHQRSYTREHPEKVYAFILALGIGVRSNLGNTQVIPLHTGFRRCC